MGRDKDLNDEEKREIIKELAKSTPLENIAKKINRHLVTVKRFVHDPMKKRKTRSDRGILKSMTKRDLDNLKRNLRKVPGAISKRIFQESGLTGIPKTTQNRILGQIVKHKASKKRPPLSSRHKDLRLNWARKYMKSDIKYVLFTDESQATLDGPDGWAKGWVINGDQAPVRRRRQQGEGGVMIWAGIIGDDLIGPVRVPQGVKLSSATYCQFLKNVLESWLEEVPLTPLKKVVFMHDNAPYHAAKATIKCLEGLGFKDKTLMVWPPNSPDINPIENLWAIIKQRVYADGKLFSTLPELHAQKCETVTLLFIYSKALFE